MKFPAAEFEHTEGGSLPARGVWIEICRKPEIFSTRKVTPREGSVD